MAIEKRSGGCHCGKVRYEVEIDLSRPVIECNCSHCQIKGLLLSFVPREAVTMLKGEDELTEYRFNTKGIAHMSCKTCGVQVFGRGKKQDSTPTSGINVRTIDDIDLSKVTRMPYDGKSR